MAKKKSWFTLVKRFFVSDSQSQQEKKEKRRKWVFARLKMKRIPSLTAPQSQTQMLQEKEEEKTEEKQSNHSLSASPVPEEREEPGPGNRRESSAVKIQTAFRGYLARKALRALKGIVTLQAIIRGRAVRRQAVTTLKRLQSIINIQSQVCATRFQPAQEGDHDRRFPIDDTNQFEDFRHKMLRMDSFGQRRWDDSLLSKEDADALFTSKKEAAIRRERIREYWHSHRRSAESERKQVSGRWRYWLEQWVDTQLTKSKELEDLDNKNPRHDCLDSARVFGPRKACHKKQCSLGDEGSFGGSPLVPAYMAATESARARARSSSSPKLRPESLDGFSPKLSLVSSIASEVPMRFGEYFHQRSPSLKGVRGPVKSSRKVKDLSVDSECSLSHWNQQR